MNDFFELSPEQKEVQLHKEASMGEFAKKCKEELLDPFFTQHGESLFELFKQCSFRDEEGLMKLKAQANALESLQQRVEYFIATGQMAVDTLNQENESETKQ